MSFQAGRAGRDKTRLENTSVSVVVCFNSPSEQQIWRRPKSLFGAGQSVPNTIPLRGDLVEGHLLCASEEFPLTGSIPVTAIVESSIQDTSCPCDCDLFGPNVYNEYIDSLKLSGSIVAEEITSLVAPRVKQIIFKARPSLRKAWSRLSIRSIEPVNYSIVNVSHPSQGGSMDGVHDSDAVLDTIPYSRVFYHAHPGSIITHRARKFKIIAMTSPPDFVSEKLSYHRSTQLAAYAKPTNARYLTRPLSSLQITVVKQLETVELEEQFTSEGTVLPPTPSKESISVPQNTKSVSMTTFAGNGIVSVKREVYGYKKISIVNRTEFSRSELKMPPFEYDTFGLYVCADPHTLKPIFGEKYGLGVHAFSHAILAVAPLFAPGLIRGDVECDHSYYSPTQVVLFDMRAGGSGCVQRLWPSFFDPEKNIVTAAIELLEECSFCRCAFGYDSGCPACLHASSCINFNMHLSRLTAISIGKRMLERIKQTGEYKRRAAEIENDCNEVVKSKESTPRRNAREKAMQKAKEMSFARDRQYVVGRPSWPMA